MSLYAALDIGSNSVRLAVADISPGQSYRLVASDREVTRIGESVFVTGRVNGKTIDYTCEVLARFRRKYQEWRPAAVRAVATSALRDARNQQEFLTRAEEAAGVPIEIISGREEARLIHLGVLTRWPRRDQSLLVLDIGGGSAEIIASENGAMRYAVSLPLGAVRLTGNFLRQDPPAPEELAALEEYIEQQFTPSLRRLGPHRQARAIGTSATAAAVVSAVNRIRSSEREDADGRRARLAEIRRLYGTLVTLGRDGRRRLPGIGPRRAEIIIAGTAVLRYFVEHFTSGSLYYSVAGLRDGIIADLAARGVTSQDLALSPQQRQVVAEMAQRYGVSLAHARQVARLGRDLFVGLASLHRLPLECGRWLEAAAYLHDIGHFVSPTRHHRHSHYLVANSDLPGFTARERRLIAALCRYHRKALPEPDHDHYRQFDPGDRQAVRLLIPLLRLADGLDRSHRQLVTSLECQVGNGETRLRVDGKPGLELDLWAARQAAAAFEEVYQCRLAAGPRR
jgi:exopolyphosphatase/guanosine-5'-triphosphate,3'-diphosphate pyrophosphatase